MILVLTLLRLLLLLLLLDLQILLRLHELYNRVKLLEQVVASLVQHLHIERIGLLYFALDLEQAVLLLHFVLLLQALILFDERRLVEIVRRLTQLVCTGR